MKGAILTVIGCISSISQAGHTPPRAIDFPTNATEIFGPYAQDNNGTYATWMSQYPDHTPLQHMTIPGTHDSATWNYTQATQDALSAITAGDGEPTYPAQVFQCQRASIMASLSAGVRFFDLRFALDPARARRLVFFHSQALLSEVATVDDVLAAFYYWLDRHPSETVVLSLQYEASTVAGAGFDETVQMMIFDVLNSTAAARYVEQTRGVLPTLGEARGKAVLFRRFELDQLPAGYEDVLPGLHLSPSLWTDDGSNIALTYNTASNLTAYIEDYYEQDDLGNNSTVPANIAAKVKATTAHLEMATSRNSSYADSLFITFASAEHVTTTPVAVTPEVMAVGADNLTTPLGGVNQQILPVLESYRGERMGVVVVDFWDQPVDLMSRIIGV